MIPNIYDESFDYGSDECLFRCDECSSEFMGKTPDYDRIMKRRSYPESCFHKDYCQSCQERFKAEMKHREDERRALEEKERKERKWDDLCPPLFKLTDRERLPQKELAIVDSWEDSGDGRGIGFVGAPGKCKTRLLYELGKKIIFSNSMADVRAITSNGLAGLSAAIYSHDKETARDAEDLINRIYVAQYLILDDVGKQKFTERAETDLYSLLDYRTSNMLPTFWSANSGSGKLAAMLSEDRAGAILRRLSEFSDIHTIS